VTGLLATQCRPGLGIVLRAGAADVTTATSTATATATAGDLLRHERGQPASGGTTCNHTKTVALYCAEQGLAIRCNSLHPAAILTRMWEPMLGHGADREARIAALVADTPLRRFGTVEEVAAAVLYLADDDSAHMTGAELNLDGGILAGSVARISDSSSG
jgi:3(or 17)beta-hydroxysteroid dehydrogenase